MADTLRSIDLIDAPHHLEKIRELKRAVTHAAAAKSAAHEQYFAARTALYAADRELKEYLDGLETEMPLFDRPVEVELDPPSRKPIANGRRRRVGTAH
jgi:hypothetical protein